MIHGATFNLPAILSALASEPWEDDPESGGQTRSVYLGSFFSCTPSGKLYTPWACSNVAGDCPVCEGTGVRSEPRTGRRARKRAAQRTSAFSRRTIKRRAETPRRGHVGEAFSRYCERIAKARKRAYVATSTTCHACGGTGSISAHRDAMWRDHWEAAFSNAGICFDSDGENFFATDWRESTDSDDTDDTYE